MRKNYITWEIKERDFPYEGDIKSKINFLLGYAVLAPSTFNSQPWVCEIEGDVVKVFLDLDKMPKISDKTGRFGLISIGCFIENFIIAASYFNIPTSLRYVSVDHKKNQLIAKIQVGTGNVLEYSHLFSYIVERATNRSLSKNIPIDKETIDFFKLQVTQNIKIVCLGLKHQADLKKISSFSDKQIWNDDDFKKEHVIWVRNNLTRKSDGMPGFGVGVPTIPSFLARPVILSNKFAAMQAKKNEAAINSTQNFVVVCSADNQQNWIQIGRLYEKISLYLTSKGMVASPMGQFIEVEEGRKALSELVKDQTSLLPQMLFRIGYPSTIVKHSPRKPVADIVRS